MKAILKVLVVAMILLNVSDAFSQTGYYKTYEDYKKDSLEVMEDWMSFYYAAGQGNVLEFKKNDQKVKVKVNEIWGFKYKGNLFRSFAYEGVNTGVYFKVSHVGKVIVYENGSLQLFKLINKAESGGYAKGYFACISKTIDSEMIALGSYNVDRTMKKLQKQFIVENPGTEIIINCETDYLKCAKEFEKK